MKFQIKSALGDNKGATAAEFAIVLPLLLLFIFGLIDAARFMWMCNQAEKATQMGVRRAIATNMIPEGLYSYSFATSGSTPLPQGSTIPQSAFGGATCQSSTTGPATCSCDSGATCPPLGTADDDAFASIVSRMSDFLPDLARENVEISYGYSGLGYAGDPYGSDVSPLITVRIKNVDFRPITSMLFATIRLPSFSTALTMEDGSGTVAN